MKLNQNKEMLKMSTGSRRNVLFLIRYYWWIESQIIRKHQEMLRFEYQGFEKGNKGKVVSMALMKNICHVLLFPEILWCLSKILHYVILDYVILDYVGIEHSLVVLYDGLHGLLQNGWTKLSNLFCYDFIEVNICRIGIPL